jgi:catechol 2,3-dioxygenase-like lactoylglutathione lyase family enzyme
MDLKELGFELAHVGINQKNAAEAKATAELLADLFGFSIRETDGSFFTDSYFEVMKTEYLGRLGHVAIRTNDVESAMEYLKSKGIAFDESTAGRTPEGKIRVIYFDKDIAGFRIHLTQK